MKNKKVIVLNDLNGKTFKLNIDRSKLSKGILNSIEGISCANRRNLKPTFANNTKIKSVNLNDKKAESKVPSPQNVVSDSSNLEEGLNYYLNQKSLNYPELLSPFMVRVLTS